MTWQRDAACRDADPELFFPPSDDDTSVIVTRLRIAVAPICSACPVATECLRWALDSGQDHGLWASRYPPRSLKILSGRDHTVRPATLSSADTPALRVVSSACSFAGYGYVAPHARHYRLKHLPNHPLPDSSNGRLRTLATLRSPTRVRHRAMSCLPVFRYASI